MGTEYEHMTDAEFWADVARVLTIIQRHQPDGEDPANAVGALADYVTAEAERRDPELAANARRRLEMVHAANERVPFDPMDMSVHFTAEEDAEFDRLYAAYRQRLTALAGQDAR